MSDDYGNLMSAAGDLSAGEMGAAYGTYQAARRVQPFVEGAMKAGQGAMLGSEIGGAVAGTIARTAAKTAITTGARVAATTAASAATGWAAGAAAGTALIPVPGVGTAIGALAGAVAPFVLPHIPIVGDVVNKIPLIGGILSPDKDKDEESSGGGSLGGGHWVPPNQNLQSPGQNVLSNRADYLAGRGFRRQG